jgi:hypothetical protein
MARAAGRLAGRWLPVARSAAKTAARSAAGSRSAWAPTAKQSGTFVKHVLPAAVKPLHSLWHQVLGFFFLALAGLWAFNVWRGLDTRSPAQSVIAIVLIIVMALYGISSIRKSQRISRS